MAVHAFIVNKLTDPQDIWHIDPRSELKLNFAIAIAYYYPLFSLKNCKEELNIIFILKIQRLKEINSEINISVYIGVVHIVRQESL